MWGAGTYERIAERFAPVHDELVRRLAPRPSERWLDVATGTGEVALRAARAGAEVTGVDLAPAMLDRARAAAEAEALEIRWEVGNAEALRFGEDEFDVVSSCFGVIFAPDHRAVASELRRVCGENGRLGLANWRPQEGLHAVYERFGSGAPVSATDDWGREEHVSDLLGESFNLEFEERVWTLEAPSPEAAWELMSSSAPPVKALVESLEPDDAAEFRHAMVDHWRAFQVDGASVREPRRYLLVYGRRR